jgi:hypothetical protein
MNRTFLVTVVALFLITGCSTGQVVESGAASPSKVGTGQSPTPNATSTTKPTQSASPGGPQDINVVPNFAPLKPGPYFGYGGKHLVLAVPDMPRQTIGGEGRWTDCRNGELKSWIAPPLSFAFYGYSQVGSLEEFWILDVDGTRLVISAAYHPDSPPADLAEMRAVLDSIRIEP